METRSSHVRVFERCKRRWYFEQVMKLEQEEVPAMEWGKAMHSELESWLKTGKPCSYSEQGMAAVKSVHLLPEPGPGLLVEHRFMVDYLVPGVEYYGTVDLADPRHGSPFQLYDHKSTASLRYAKKVSELVTDVSATFYAFCLRAMTGLTQIKARWIYTERKRDGAVRPVDFLMTRDGINDRMEKTERSVRAMLDTSKAESFADVEPSPKACNDFNRKCQYWEVCEFNKHFQLAKNPKNTVPL